MSERFEMTPKRLATWAAMAERGCRLPQIAHEMGCCVATLVRHKRRMGTINRTKSRAGKLGMASRYAREASP